ncbi:uncharacterized protein [Anolis sagrei]|uniref:uncharacterized protein isoform X4 n=1 Tax=Anolis sagrei TaxID=38937 RepID=UPI003522003A
METAPLRWKAITGFLVMNLHISVTSAIMCHSITNYTQTGVPGYVSSYLPDEPAITCLPIHNACITIRLELSTVSNTLFIDHRSCATTKYPNGGKESSKTGDKYFAIKYKANYCSSDLCNGKIPSADAHNKTALVKENCKPSSLKKCYAGINFHDSETLLEAVTCRSDSDFCYQGSGYITIGNGALHLHIRSCQSTCHVPQKQVFGPIEISMQGVCCFGNHCNRKENAHPTPTNQAWETTSGLYGHRNQTSNFTDPGHGYGLFRDFECEDYIVDNGTEWSVIDPGAKGKGGTLQISALLVTLVVTFHGLTG